MGENMLDAGEAWALSFGRSASAYMDLVLDNEC